MSLEKATIRHLLIIKEAAEILQVSVKTVRRLITAGDLPFVRIAKSCIRIHASDLERYITARRSL
ncbi:MAG TPA: helix-turn-helix domain-containing protein [Rhizomicrobium sp.]|nr:helix-turn-helix domain-containing protein [Rhizomicrobium sp.]